MPVQFQNDTIIITSNLTASRLHEIWIGICFQWSVEYINVCCGVLPHSTLKRSNFIDLFDSCHLWQIVSKPLNTRVACDFERHDVHMMSLWYYHRFILWNLSHFPCLLEWCSDTVMIFVHKVLPKASTPNTSYLSRLIRIFQGAALKARGPPEISMITWQLWCHNLAFWYDNDSNSNRNSNSNSNNNHNNNSDNYNKNNKNNDNDNNNNDNNDNNNNNIEE